MTDAAITALTIFGTAALAAIPPTIAAYAALREGRKNTKTTDATAAQMDATAAKMDDNTMVTEATAVKTDDLVKKTDEIHTLTNGNLTEVRSSLAVAHEQIKGLQALVKVLVDRDHNGRNGEPH